MSGELSKKERLLRVLSKDEVDRPPVICTGGMMNSAIVDIMKQSGHLLPAAHLDPTLMSQLAEDVHNYSGFENIGIPFCMTIEAEQLGSDINLGTLECEPKIASEKFKSNADVIFKDIDEMAFSGRMAKVAEAAKILSAAHPDVPVIGSLTGPVSTAASIVDPMTFYRELRKNKESAHRVLDYVTKLLIKFARNLIRNGASVISVGDPSATGEILGPAMFEEYALRYLNQLCEAVHESGHPVIIHICGDMKRVNHLIPALRSDAISTDAMVNLKALKEQYPQLCTMGNLSTYTLEWGNPDKIRKATEVLVEDRINIISPACGLSTATSVKNLRALTDTVKEIA